jgi:hypothetical protein
MEKLTYENIMDVVKRYCKMLPELTLDSKDELAAIFTSECIFSCPDGEPKAGNILNLQETHLAHIYYEPWPMYILVDYRKNMADCILREEMKNPDTGKLVQAFPKDQKVRLPNEYIAYSHGVFEVTIHEGKTKIKNILKTPIDSNGVEWQRWRDSSQHAESEFDGKLTYSSMMTLVKKYCDMLPELTPKTKHEMEAICTPDCIFSYPDGQTEADHVANHWQIYRAHLYYEPWPLYIIVDDRKKMAKCVLKEVAKHPKTNEPVEAIKNEITGKIEDTVYMHEHFQFTVHEGKVKINNIFMSDIDTNSLAWKNWRNSAKPN